MKVRKCFRNKNEKTLKVKNVRNKSITGFQFLSLVEATPEKQLTMDNGAKVQLIMDNG